MKATICLATSFLLAFLLSPSGWALSPEAEPSQLVSHLFAHNSWSHLGANVCTLLLFGTLFERRQGPLRTLALFLVAGVLSGLAETYADPGYTGVVLGASGGLSAFLGTFARESRAAAWFVLAVLAYYSIQALIPGGPNADWAHLAGLSIGLLWTTFETRSTK